MCFNGTTVSYFTGTTVSLSAFQWISMHAALERWNIEDFFFFWSLQLFSKTFNSLNGLLLLALFCLLTTFPIKHQGVSSIVSYAWVSIVERLIDTECCLKPRCWHFAPLYVCNEILKYFHHCSWIHHSTSFHCCNQN